MDFVSIGELLLLPLGFFGQLFYLGILADNALSIHIRPQRFVRQAELISTLARRLSEHNGPAPQLYQSDDRTHRVLAWSIIIVFLLLTGFMRRATGSLILWGTFLAVLAPLVWLGPGVDLLILLGGHRFARLLTEHETWFASIAGALFLVEAAAFIVGTVPYW